MTNQKQHIGLVFALTIVIMLGTSLYCQAETTLVFGSVPDIPPLSFEQDGALKGFLLDAFREAAQRAGFDVTIELYPVKRMEAYLQSGKLDGAVSMLPTEKREQYLIFSTTPIMVSRLLVFVKKGREFPFKSVEDLKGKKIGAILGWKTGDNALEQAISEGTVQLEEVSYYDQNLKKLIANRVDCIISTEQLTWYHANQLGVAEELTALEIPLTEYSVFSAISKHTKNVSAPQEFIEKMSVAFDEIQSDGTYEELQRKYKVTSLN